MKFEDLLNLYEHNIEYANRMMTEDCLSFYKKDKQYWIGYKIATNNWFEALKDECSDFNPKIRREISKEEERECKYIDEQGYEHTPVGMFKYRGEDVPVYLDDYGQQEYIIYEGREICGGAYNLAPEYDFCYMIDKIKDEIEF